MIQRLHPGPRMSQAVIHGNTVYLADIATFGQMNSVWDLWVPQGHTPARATVEARLAASAYKVEIQVIAARDWSPGHRASGPAAAFRQFLA